MRVILSSQYHALRYSRTSLIDQDLEKHLIPITIYQPILVKKKLVIDQSY